MSNFFRTTIYPDNLTPQRLFQIRCIYLIWETIYTIAILHISQEFNVHQNIKIFIYVHAIALLTPPLKPQLLDIGALTVLFSSYLGLLLMAALHSINPWFFFSPPDLLTFIAMFFGMSLPLAWVSYLHAPAAWTNFFHSRESIPMATNPLLPRSTLSSRLRLLTRPTHLYPIP